MADASAKVRETAAHDPAYRPTHRSLRTNFAENLYGAVVGTAWGQIVPDGIGAFGVVVAAGAAWRSQRTSSKSIDVSRTMAEIERDRRHGERVPRLSARVESWGIGQTGFVLSVWLESPEPLSEIRVVVQEARNSDCPIGFSRQQYGVPSELPPAIEAEGILPAWKSDTVHPLANWTQQMAPGTAATWHMELRHGASTSSGADGVRFKALAWAERDEQRWELPLPVSITDNARALLNQAAGQSGR
jgi:hypothetical protein